MIYWGSTPEPAGDGLVSIAIRNRRARVIVGAGMAETLVPHELFQDQAGTIWVQNVLGKRWQLARPYQIQEN